MGWSASGSVLETYPVLLWNTFQFCSSHDSFIPSRGSQYKRFELFVLPIDILFLLCRSRNFERVIGFWPIRMQTCIPKHTPYHDCNLFFTERHAFQLPYLGRISDFPRFPRRCRCHTMNFIMCNSAVPPILVGFFCTIACAGRSCQSNGRTT